MISVSILSLRHDFTGTSNGREATRDLLGALVLAPFNAHKHYVTVVWREKDQDKWITTEVRDDHRALLDELQMKTGVDWRVRDAERKSLRATFNAEKQYAFTVKIEQPVRLDVGSLARGKYHAIFLPDSGDRGELVFIKGSITKPKEIAGSLAVTFEPKQSVVVSVLYDRLQYARYSRSRWPNEGLSRRASPINPRGTL